jgi:hypothetical protein
MDAPQTDLSWDLETPDLAVVKREVGRFLKPFTLEAHTQHRYRARLFRRRLRSADLAVIDYGGAVTVDAGRISRCYLLQVPLSGAYTVRTAGRPLQVNTRFAHLISPGTPLDMTWTHDCRILVLRFNEAAMAACLRHEHRPPSDMSGGELLALDAAPNQSLARILDYVTREATTGHLFDHVPLAAAHAESLLFAGLRSTVTPERERRTHRSAPAYVRRAESFLLQHLEMPGVKVADVVRAAGTSRAWRRPAALAACRATAARSHGVARGDGRTAAGDRHRHALGLPASWAVLCGLSATLRRNTHGDAASAALTHLSMTAPHTSGRLTGFCP